MLTFIWILSMCDKSEVVECFNENSEKILQLSGSWKDKRELIFPQLTKNTQITDCRRKGNLGLELAIWLKEGGK
jgi:hypothetical protein